MEIQPDTSGTTSANLKIEAADAISDTATVSIHGNDATRLWVNAADTIGKLVINGAAQPLGTYGASGSGADLRKDLDQRQRHPDRRRHRPRGLLGHR